MQCNRSALYRIEIEIVMVLAIFAVALMSVRLRGAEARLNRRRQAIELGCRGAACRGSHRREIALQQW